jgi:hypothetical protein
MKTMRSRKAVSNVLAMIIVTIIVIIVIVAAAHVYYNELGTNTSDSKGSATATGPSVIGKSGSRDTNPPPLPSLH